MKKILLISFISTFFLGVINAAFLLFTIKTFEKKLKKTGFMDEVSSELLTGGLASAIVLFFVTIIRYNLQETYKILHHPAIDIVGIILGTIFVILIHKYSTKNQKVTL
jgi:putative flippase GtrA